MDRQLKDKIITAVSAAVARECQLADPNNKPDVSVSPCGEFRLVFKIKHVDIVLTIPAVGRCYTINGNRGKISSKHRMVYGHTSQIMNDVRDLERDAALRLLGVIS